MEGKRGGMQVRGRGGGRGRGRGRPILSGLGSQASGARFRGSGSGTGSGPEFYPVPAPVPDNPYLRPEGRDLGPEIVFTFAPLHRPKAALHFCTSDGSESRPYPLPLKSSGPRVL